MRIVTLLLPIVLAACGPVADDSDFEEIYPDDPSLAVGSGKADGESTVGDFILNGNCSTAPIIGLATQMADLLAERFPDELVPFAEMPGVRFVGGAVLPYISPLARDQLRRAGQATGDIRIESALRMLPQQVMILEWGRNSVCGYNPRSQIAPAGKSPHESGRSVDAKNWREVGDDLTACGLIQDVYRDPPHHTSVRAVDLRREDVLLFQQLWNLNNPGDMIDTDGLYGPQTRQRVLMAPADGFRLTNVSIL